MYFKNFQASYFRNIKHPIFLLLLKNSALVPAETWRKQHESFWHHTVSIISRVIRSFISYTNLKIYPLSSQLKCDSKNSQDQFSKNNSQDQCLSDWFCSTTSKLKISLISWWLNLKWETCPYIFPLPPLSGTYYFICVSNDDIIGLQVILF